MKIPDPRDNGPELLSIFRKYTFKSALISDTFEKGQKTSRYGSKCLKLPKSFRNAKVLNVLLRKMLQSTGPL